MSKLLRYGDVVQHNKSKKIGKVTGFAYDGSMGVLVNETGPYPQYDWTRLVPESAAVSPCPNCGKICLTEDAQSVERDKVLSMKI